MKKINLVLALLFALTLMLPVAFGQSDVSDYKGESLYRYQNIHSGNKVRTIFYNYGLVGNVGEISGEWPLGTGNEYVGDVTPLVGIELKHPNGQTYHTVITSLGPRQSPEYGETGTFWGFEPLPGFAQPPVPGEVGQVAMSHQRETWPDFWPDKYLSDPRDILWQRDEVDPGWPNQWNGFFGKDVTNADQESYFQMDDHQDWELRYLPDANGVMHAFYPSSVDTSRGGMGIRVAVRGFQWSHFLAEDCLIWHYEISNIGTTNYDKVAFGMVVGTLSGGRQDSEDDLALFDPENNITYSWDSDDVASPGWVPVREGQINVGYAGYAFLESPGNPYDGIDNDGDADSIDASGPRFDEYYLRSLVDSTMSGLTYDVGDPMVIIDYETYERTLTEMPASGILEWDFRGETRTVNGGVTLYENMNNGIDDNFNGLIDERWIAYDEALGDRRLDHVGRQYIDYFTGDNLDNPLIDEARDDGIDNDGDWDILTDDVGYDGAPGTGDLGEGDGIPTLGEPHFDKTDIDESDQIGLTSFDYFSPPGAIRMNDDDALWSSMTPGRVDVIPGAPEDGDFVYGSGYFPLSPGQTERFSIALFFGEDLTDITQNKESVQQIYDNNYNFARPPDKPTVTAVSGDGSVTLYWDDASEHSYDPSNIGNENDFEGYKIYRATDPGFLENFTITDGLGRTVFHSPIAQFDLDNDKEDFYPVSVFGASFYLGKDTGLTHVWTDTTVENGQQYYYAVTAYDNGNPELGFFPAETSKFIFVDEGGNVTTDVNTVVVTPGVKAAGYKPPVVGSASHMAGSGTGVIYAEVVDPTLIDTSKTYDISFEWETVPELEDDGDTTWVDYLRYNIYSVDGTTTSPIITLASMESVFEDKRVLGLFDSYFQGVFNDRYETLKTRDHFLLTESPVFDGQRAYIIMPRTPGDVIESASGWHSAADTDSLYKYRFSVANYSQYYLEGIENFADYDLIFHDSVVDTSDSLNWYNLINFPRTPIYFRVKNLNTGEYTRIVFDETSADATPNGMFDLYEAINLYETLNIAGVDTTVLTWQIQLEENLQNGRIYPPQPDDTLHISMVKAFNEDDVFRFTTEASYIDEDEVDLNKIKVYPNPYLCANTQEPANPYASGRGERRLTFIHLPKKCTIRIYNMRGELVDTIEHDTSREDGMAHWDLRTKDNLDAAYGIYIFHVDSEYGDHTGKFAVIK